MNIIHHRHRGLTSRAAVSLLSPMIALAVACSGGSLHAESARMRQFRSDYGLMSIELLNNPASVGMVKEFVYQKDAATFTLHDGKLIFLRFLNSRPTTALFVGKGHVQIAIPHRAERENLRQILGDSLVDQDFTTCAFHFADDFDLAANAKYTFTAGKLDWDDYNLIMKAQAENYFPPSVYVQRDNFAQLVWSAMDRKADGFFWADFGRSAYSYDPNRPEENEILVEREPADQYLTTGAQFCRQDRAAKTDALLSSHDYPFSITEQKGSMQLSGTDGAALKQADAFLTISVQAAQMIFLPVYVDRHLTVDSVWVNGTLSDFWKRSDHEMVYVFPETPAKQGDSLTIHLQYHGDNYGRIFPWIDNPAAVYTPIDYDAPKGFTYFVPGMGKVTVEGGRQHFSSQYDPPVRQQSLVSIATGYDSTLVETKSGFPISFYKVRAYSHGGLTDAKYQEMVVATYEALADILGNPPATFSLTVLPYGDQQAPGIASIPQLSTDLDGTGGFALTAALALSEQWYGISSRPAGSREQWLIESLRQSVGLLAVQRVKNSSAMFSEIGSMVNQVALGVERKTDRPLAGHLDWRIPKGQNTGQTNSTVFMNNEIFRAAMAGVAFNMIRFELYDLTGDNGDAAFYKLLRELTSRVTSATFTNADIAAIAQKYTGHDMTAWFDTFIFGGETPKIDGTYKPESADGKASLAWKLNVTNVPANFSAPVVIRVTSGTDSKLFREILNSGENSFSTAGLAGAPSEVYFNEFFSLLSRDNIKK